MSFNWDGRYILRRVEETDPQVHRIYKHSDQSDSITNAINVVDWAPAKASRRYFEANPIDPPEPWLVKIAGVEESVLMGCFQLKKV